MKAVASISTAIIVLLIGYFFGAFIAADFNIKNWDGLGRFLVAAFSLLSAIGCAIGVMENVE